MQLHSLLTYSSIAIRLQQNSKIFNKPDVANERLRPLFGSGIGGFMQWDYSPIIGMWTMGVKEGVQQASPHQR